MKVKLKFPDKSVKEYEKGITGNEILKKLPKQLQKKALAIKVDENLYDLTTPITSSGTFTILTFDDTEGKSIFWHSSSHIMAEAILRLFPKAQPAIGPSIEEGFYYDFYNLDLVPEDFPKVEKEIYKILKESQKFVRTELTNKKALAEFKSNKFKTEMIKDLGDVSTYTVGSFSDLCRGPHVVHSGKIKSFKLTKVSGAYWRADASKEQLTRVYGISFPDSESLQLYLKRIQEAERRDHRKIGARLDLFSLHDEGPGFVFWHPNGMIIYNELLDFWRKEHRMAGYDQVMTPVILSKKLWLQSGHWEHYQKNMYFTKIDKEDFAVKPMNCPGGIIIYKNKKHSYKEFPLRLAEVGLDHRHEMSGVLHGLFRVRSFWQDDAHLYCLPEQLEDEIVGVVNLTDKFYKMFGFEYTVELSTRPKKFLGKKQDWDKAEDILKKALKKVGLDFQINEGDGAFYGPKIDFHIKDSMGRTWQCGTCQLDFQMPEKFDLTYMGPDGTENHRPIMLHRVIYGSLERFIGVLIEHFAGKLPLWLSPYQVRILPIADKFNDYSKEVNKILFEAGIRCAIDDSQNTIGKKIREAQMDKVNYMLIIGEKELEKKTLAIRSRDTGETEYKVSTKDFLKRLEKEIKSKSLQ
jgi:threonyl-tRNA synthetase